MIEDYNVVIIRYAGEIWLKSQKVKMRMLKILMNNIKRMLERAEIPYHKYQISKDSARILYFFDNSKILDAMKILQKVFGIYSLSPSIRTSNRIKNISERTIEIAKKVLNEGDTFALRVRRSGNHDYSSQDVARIVGQDVMDYFTNLDLKVDLTNPEKEIFIEVRGEFSYIYTEIILTDWEGLPIEYNKKIISIDIGRLEDLLASFFLIRRGCEVYPVLFQLTDSPQILETWIQNWKVIHSFTPYKNLKVYIINLIPYLENVIESGVSSTHICMICRIIRFEIISLLRENRKITKISEIKAISDGLTFNSNTLCNDEVDLQTIALSLNFFNLPIFTPLIGLNEDNIEARIQKISADLTHQDYCKFKPVNQTMDLELALKIYKKSRSKSIITRIVDSMKIIEIE